MGRCLLAKSIREFATNSHHYNHKYLILSSMSLGSSAGGLQTIYINSKPDVNIMSHTSSVKEQGGRHVAEGGTGKYAPQMKNAA